MSNDDVIKQIGLLIDEYWKNKIEEQKDFQDKYIQYSGPTLDSNDIKSAVNVLIDGWFGLGKIADEFEQRLAQFISASKSVVVNSGSSANLLAIAALKSKKLKKPLVDGDEVITAIAGFPTSINPIIQNNLIPVFIDINLGDYNIDIHQIEKAITARTKAVFVVHTLGNPVNMNTVMKIAGKYNLKVIEDCCDALGSEYDGKKVGSFGDMSTFSFYPAHHITTGEGGAILTSDMLLDKIIRSLRDWGRDCYCNSRDSLKVNGACNKRFSKWLPELDIMIDHKYVYSEIGYNLKPLELQCALGLSQLSKLQNFIKSRNYNFKQYYDFFRDYQDFFILPSWDKSANPSWFGFALTIKNTAPFKRYDLISFLESNKIQTRNLFAGNIIFHPAYKSVRYKMPFSTPNADLVTTNTFFLGVYPGIDKEKMQYILDVIAKFMKRYK